MAKSYEKMDDNWGYPHELPFASSSERFFLTRLGTWPGSEPGLYDQIFKSLVRNFWSHELEIMS